MGAKRSAEMVHALDLVINHGKTAYAAAKLANISESAINKNPDYRKFIQTRKQTEEKNK